MHRLRWILGLLCACNNLVTFERLPPPTIDGLEPVAALPGTVVRLTGAGLLSGALVRVGSTPATVAAGPAGGQLDFYVPEGETGTVDVTVTNLDGQYATWPAGFTVLVADDMDDNVTDDMDDNVTDDMDECPQLSPPTNIAATADATGITLTWTATPSAVDGVVVQRSNDGIFDDLDTVAALATEYLDIDVDRDAINTYRVLAFQGACWSNPSDEVTVATLVNAPTGFSGAATGPTSIALTWTDTNGNESGFQLARSVADAATFVVIAAELEADTQAFADTNVSAGARYDYRLYALNADGLLSSAVSATVCAYLAAPTDVATASDGNNSVTLEWGYDFAANPVDGTLVQRSVVGTWTTLATLEPYVWDFIDTGSAYEIEPDRVYSYRLLTTKGQCTSQPTSTIASYSVPNAPTGLAATTAGAANVALTWTDPNNLEGAYRVDRRALDAGTFAAIVELPASSQEYNDTSVDPARGYEYRVYALSQQDDLSAPATTTTATATAAPTALALTVSAPRALDVNVSDPNAGRAQLSAEWTVWSAGACPAATPSVDFVPTGYIASQYTASASTIENLDTNTCYAVRTCATYNAETACSDWQARRTSFAPQLSFDSVSLSDACVLAAAGHATFDVGSAASYASADTNLTLTSATVGATGIVGTVPISLGDGVSIDWTVADNLGASTTLLATYQIDQESTVFLAPDWPSLTGSIAVQGGQVWHGEDIWADGNCTYCSGTAAKLALGGKLGCALVPVGNDMGVRCWGQDGPDAGSSYDLNPMYVCTPGWQSAGCEASGQLTGVTDISIGETHACAVLSSGQARCWGEEYLGNMVTVDSQTVPVVVLDSNGTPQGGIKTAALGTDHTCLLLTSGEVKCWGSNALKQLGFGGNTVGSFFFPAKPVCASGSHADGNCTALTGVLAIDAGGDFTCVVTEDHLAKCWGYRNNAGKLGDGIQDPGSAANPVTVVRDDNSSALTGVRAIGTGDMFACALLESGKVACWGYWGSLGWKLKAKEVCIEYNDATCLEDLQDAVAIAVGAAHMCAIVADGTVYCGGGNAYGELGEGTVFGTVLGSLTPVCATGSGASCVALTDAIALSAGRNATCAMLASGAVQCWGDARYGLLAIGEQLTNEASCGYNCKLRPTAACLTGTYINNCSGFSPDMRTCTRYTLEPDP